MIEEFPEKRELEERMSHWRWSVAFLAAGAFAIGLAAALGAISFANQWLLGIAAALGLALFCATIAFLRAKSRLKVLAAARDDVDAALSSSSSGEITQLRTRLEAAAARDGAIQRLYARFSNALEWRMNETLEAEVLERRRGEVSSLCADAKRSLIARIEKRHLASPALRSERVLTAAIDTLKRERAAAERRLDEARERKKLTWWFDLTRPGFEEVDGKIEELEAAHRRLIASGALQEAKERRDAIAARVSERTAEIERAALSSIPAKRHERFDDRLIVQNALLLSALSIPLSAWGDISQAGGVFDSLREVNGKYADMSDTEIWFDTLTMPGPELAGLASLAKGALFEKHVETGFGGERFENFNNPDTDILIDGVAYQIKATDSVSYVDSVPDDIPVISTSEIAEITGAIDGGYSNEELNDAVDLALGGTVIDFTDTALDAVLAGVGGVGIFAILRGAQEATAKFKESGDAIEASVAGVGATATSTAKSVVNMAEIATKGTIGVAKSKPLRFVGGLVARGVERFDRWIEKSAAAPDRDSVERALPPKKLDRDRR